MRKAKYDRAIFLTKVIPTYFVWGLSTLIIILCTNDNKYKSYRKNLHKIETFFGVSFTKICFVVY